MSKIADNRLANNASITDNGPSSHNNFIPIVNDNQSIKIKTLPRFVMAVKPNEICISDDSVTFVKDQSCVSTFDDRKSNKDCKSKTTTGEIINRVPRSNEFNI